MPPHAVHTGPSMSHVPEVESRFQRLTVAPSAGCCGILNRTTWCSRSRREPSGSGTLLDKAPRCPTASLKCAALLDTWSQEASQKGTAPNRHLVTTSPHHLPMLWMARPCMLLLVLAQRCLVFIRASTHLTLTVRSTRAAISTPMHCRKGFEGGPILQPKQHLASICRLLHLQHQLHSH